MVTISPMAPDFPTHPHHSDIVTYFEQYARHFDVIDKIKFNTRVKSVDLIDNDRWRVLHAPVMPGTSDIIDEHTEQDIFDAVLICNGHHNTPVRIITIYGSEYCCNIFFIRDKYR